MRLTYGPTNGEFLLRSFAHATVGANGTFRTSFKVTCQFGSMSARVTSTCVPARAYPLPLIVGVFSGKPGCAGTSLATHRCTKLATTAFIVTPA